jgi:hypothetical protein
MMPFAALATDNKQIHDRILIMSRDMHMGQVHCAGGKLDTSVGNQGIGIRRIVLENLEATNSEI